MGFDVEKIFEDAAYLSKVHTKKDYEKQMDMFKERRYDLLADLINADDVAAASKQLCLDVNDKFKKFGKVRGSDLMNLNYFLIYYVFPSILMNEEKGQDICEALKDAWNSQFKANINFTDYETLMAGFQTKIFGIPIGKN